MKLYSFKYFNTITPVREYSILYKKLNFKNSYPADVMRLKIIKSLLEKYNPKKIIDAGCGAGMPLITLKKAGFNIKGYDKAENMIKEAKINLKQNKLSTDLAFIDNFEKPNKLKKNSVDCILGMGAFYYSKNFEATIKNQRQILKKNGRLIFSLRNKLFDLSTFNDYSLRFYKELFFKNLKKKHTSKFNKLTKNFNKRKKKKLLNIDDRKVHTFTNNPLTIKAELKKLGLDCTNILFYHFHSLPPLFEEIDPIYFRKTSWKMENPYDWRGHFLASGFIVDCKKI